MKSIESQTMSVSIVRVESNPNMMKPTPIGLTVKSSIDASERKPIVRKEDVSFGLGHYLKKSDSVGTIVDEKLFT